MSWLWFIGEILISAGVYMLGFAHGAIYMRRSLRRLIGSNEFGKLFSFTSAVQQQAEWMNKTGGTVEEAAMFKLIKGFHDEHASEAHHPSAEAGNDGTGSEWRVRQDD